MNALASFLPKVKSFFTVNINLCQQTARCTILALHYGCIGGFLLSSQGVGQVKSAQALPSMLEYARRGSDVESCKSKYRYKYHSAQYAGVHVSVFPKHIATLAVPYQIVHTQ